MVCPRCESKLSTQTHRGVSVDVCGECRGTFLDRGELNRVAEPTVGDLEFSTLHGESFLHEDSFGPTRCPRCVDETMDKVEFNVHSGIILDHCKRCSGFWLDVQELNRIDREVHDLNESDTEASPTLTQWLAQFIWSLPR